MTQQHDIKELPHFSYECAAFIRDYLPTFRAVFGGFCQEGQEVPKLPISTELYAEKLYLVMFSQSGASNLQLLENTLRDFVTDTLDAESVLLKTWMHMINDFVDVLEDTSASTHLLLELVDWIDHLSLALYHTYFHISQEATRENTNWSQDLQQQAEALTATYQGLLRGSQDTHDSTPVELSGRCYFRGIEIRLLAKLQATRKDRITCQAEPRFCAALSRTEFAILDGPKPGSKVIAEVLAVDLKQSQVAFNRFRQLPKNDDRRHGVRVEPAVAVDLKLVHAAGQSRGTIIDISANSMAVYLRNTGVDMASRIVANFSLPNPAADARHRDFELEAVVSGIRADRRGDPRAHVLVLQLEMDNPARTALSQYVMTRQSEILSEIRHIMEERE